MDVKLSVLPVLIPVELLLNVNVKMENTIIMDKLVTLVENNVKLVLTELTV